MDNSILEMINSEKVEREAVKAQINRAELVERIGRAAIKEETIQVLPGLYFNHASAPAQLHYVVSDPAFCVIAQGSKEIMLGDKHYHYDPEHYLLATVEMPIVSQVTSASKEEPYLSLRLQLDHNLISSAIAEAGYLAHKNPTNVRGIDVSVLDAQLLDATVRLVRLVENPSEARMLAPMITREIVYRLLMGEQGERLRHLAVLGGQHQSIIRVIERIRKDFDKPMRIEDVAQEFGMSVSGLHHQFKAVTAMSPLQFQKQLRLQEARRLMLTQNLDAASAGYRVGYDDASHFNREYKSLFGKPPMRDAERLREAVSLSV